MSGLVRNLITLFLALLSRHRSGVGAAVDCHFWITPFDCGTRVLKSDRYLLLAEAAQIDFLARTGLMGKLLRSGIRFVNVSQLVKFSRPVGMFSRVRMETRILHADARCAYFSHALFLREQKLGEVLVKMKFKQGSITVAPSEITGPTAPSDKPSHLQAWDDALAAMS